MNSVVHIFWCSSKFYIFCCTERSPFMYEWFKNHTWCIRTD